MNHNEDIRMIHCSKMIEFIEGSEIRGGVNKEPSCPRPKNPPPGSNPKNNKDSFTTYKNILIPTYLDDTINKYNLDIVELLKKAIILSIKEIDQNDI